MAAVEQGPADLLMVRDPGAPEILEGVGVIGGRARRPRSLRGEGVPTLRHEMALGQEDRIRFIWPAAQAYAGSGQGAGPGSELFASSQEFTARDGGLFWLLTRVVHPHGEGTGARLADAVAVAGIQALAGNHRRAVLLVLTGETADASRYDPAAVRRYLESIRVPLLVWSLRQPPYPPAVETWGGDVWDVSTLPKLQKAVEHLQAELAAQRIVWVEGLHLPQSIAVAPEAGERQPALR